MKPLRIAFAGELFSGKDHVAAQVCATKIGFADPIYAVSRHFNGTDDKKVPGIRRFMQLVGQWGWGFVSDDPDYQHSPTRALLSSQIVALGSRGIFGREFVGWEEFGKSRTLWVDMLWTRLQLIEQSCAITNVRFPHEVEFCTAAGIPLYLVECSMETRLERLAAAGSKLTEKELCDTSEKLPTQLRGTLPDYQVIWNDHQPMPAGKNYLTLEEFGMQIANGEAVRRDLARDAAMATVGTRLAVEIPDPLAEHTVADQRTQLPDQGPGVALIHAERLRQLKQYSWTHDAEEHPDGELAFRAAELVTAGMIEGELAAYTKAAPDGPHAYRDTFIHDDWSLILKTRHDRVQQLTVAGALIAAEIDRLTVRVEQGQRTA